MRIITLLLWLLLGGLYFYLWNNAQKNCCQPQDDDLSGLLYEPCGKMSEEVVRVNY